MSINDLYIMVDSALEQDIYNKITKENFFDILKEAKIDLKTLSKKRKKIDYPQYHSFNFLVKELHEKKKIDIADSCIYIETELLPVKNIIQCLNEENTYLLRCSLAERNGIKMKKNSLDSFMYE